MYSEDWLIFIFHGLIVVQKSMVLDIYLINLMPISRISIDKTPNNVFPGKKLDSLVEFPTDLR